MKIKIRNEFLNNLSYENLWKCYKLAIKGKMSNPEILEFSYHASINVMELYHQLKDQTYEHGGYKVFYVYEPKKRKVESANFVDRIVHMWVNKFFLDIYYVPTFIRTTYACIKGRGAHLAVQDVQKGMKKYERKYGHYYILKMDVRKYFESIDKEVLLEILKRKIADDYLENLLDQIVYSHKEEKGLPIGNYTSQTFANIYLNEVDQYIKTELKVKQYYRYMDDMIILTRTKEYAIELLEKIKKFLSSKLKLYLNGKTQIFPSSNGLTFCGYHITEKKITIKTKGKKRLKAKVKKLEEGVRYGLISSEEASIVLSGHRGYLQIAESRNLEKHLFSDFEYVLNKETKPTQMQKPKKKKDKNIKKEKRKDKKEKTN